MNEREQEIMLVMSGLGIDMPERCRNCSKIGDLAAKLLVAQDNVNFLTVSTDPEVTAANIRSQLTPQIRERYDGATDDQVEGLIDHSVESYLASDRYADFLKSAGELLGQEDAVINHSLDDIKEAIGKCPPSGCDSYLEA